MSKFIVTALLNTGFMSLALYASATQSEAAIRVIYFFGWWHLVMAPLLLIAMCTKRWADSHQPSGWRRVVPREADGAFDIALMSIYAWNGWYLPAIASLFVMLATQSLYDWDKRLANE